MFTRLFLHFEYKFNSVEYSMLKIKLFASVWVSRVDLGPPFRGSAIPGYYCYNNPNPNPNPRSPEWRAVTGRVAWRGHLWHKLSDERASGDTGHNVSVTQCIQTLMIDVVDTDRHSIVAVYRAACHTAEHITWQQHRLTVAVSLTQHTCVIPSSHSLLSHH